MTASPGSVLMYYRGQLDADGTQFGLFTPVGLLSTSGGVFDTHHGINTAVHLGAGVVAVPRLATVRLSDGTKKGPYHLCGPAYVSPLLGLQPVLAKPGAEEVELAIVLQVETWSLAESDGEEEEVGLPNRRAAVEVEADPARQQQLFRVGGKEYLLLGSCEAGRFFRSETDLLFPETFAALYRGHTAGEQRGARRQREESVDWAAAEEDNKDLSNSEQQQQQEEDREESPAKRPVVRPEPGE